MKIRSVTANNRKKAFEVTTATAHYLFPYAKLAVRPSPHNPIGAVCIDKELANEAFTYQLESGEEGTVHVEQVLDYNRDPGYLRDLLLYRLTLAAQKGIKRTSLSRQELQRRLGASPAHLDRLLDQTNYAKSIDQLVALLNMLDCDVDLVVKKRSRSPATV